MDRLKEYRAKRSPDRTPEPFGGGGARPRLFVVQKHDARRLHYDFRLELGGTLRSWAVPKGPSFDPGEKRLAVQVEDHPVEYADFEGIIPQGNYGAGPVIVWDRGAWTALEDPEEGLVKGKLLFELRGYKLRGVWTLVRTKARGRDAAGGAPAPAREWLLIKHQDAHASSAADARLGPESILSGLTLDDLASSERRAAAVDADLERLGAPRRAVEARSTTLMLAERRPAAFTAPGWLFELKYDGYRLLAERQGSAPRLVYRRGGDATALFPEIARALAALPGDRFLLDGEVVVLDATGRPSFHDLQLRTQLRRAADVERAAVERPATLFAFDLLAFGGLDARPLPLAARKEVLRRLLPRAGPIRFADHVDEQGEALFERVRAMGLEGVMAKRSDAPYKGGRSEAWLKIRLQRTGDFVICGYTAPQGSRTGLGALDVAAYDGAGRLVYAGKVGTGFAEPDLATLRRQLEPLQRSRPACTGALPRGGRHVWVEPRLVCEVQFMDFTGPGRMLRQAVFLRLRDDKAPEECVQEGPTRASNARQGGGSPELCSTSDSTPACRSERRKGGRERPPLDKTVTLTNPDKPFWPEDGHVKRDLFEYYRAVAGHILPYLRARPLVMTRFPDGIHGKSFYQHDAPVFLPPWIRTERVWSDSGDREKAYIVCDDEETLLFMANLATIPLHVWSSRVGRLERPDWCVLDLDAKQATFRDAVEVARAVRALCEDLELPAFVKTSGQSGLHVLVPLGGLCTHEQSRALAQLLVRVVEQRIPDRATTTMSIERRGARVYLDWLQNGHGKTIAAPLCVRPRPGAPVSTPLRWSELTARLDPARFNIRTVPRRLDKVGDLLHGVLDRTPDLPRALERLAERLRNP